MTAPRPSRAIDGDEQIVLRRGEHSIRHRYLGTNAVKILHRLKNQGYEAYVVGGGVRDLLLRRKPKDIDIGTDATPGVIRRLFRNSRIIGRRFKIAHVYFRGGIIEVSTFRSAPHPGRQDDQFGPITNDNRYGSPAEDASRRDFTVNALFYDFARDEVIDHVGGLKDMERQIIRSIGPPVERIREDPVRMLRACEFAARLGFGIEEELQDAIRSERHWIEQAAPARLTEELIQLLGCGAFGRALQWMVELDLADIYLPGLNLGGVSEEGRFAGLYYTELDRRVAEKDGPSDAAMLGSLLLPVVEYDLRKWEQAHGKPATAAAVREAAFHRIDLLSQRFALSNARTHDTVAALGGFGRMRKLDWKPHQRVQLARKPYFADALQIWETYAQVEGLPRDEFDHWHEASTQARASHPPKRPRHHRKPRRRRRRRPRR